MASSTVSATANSAGWYKHSSSSQLTVGSTTRRPSRYSVRCHAGVFPGRCEQVKGSFSKVEKTIS